MDNNDVGSESSSTNNPQRRDRAAENDYRQRLRESSYRRRERFLYNDSEADRLMRRGQFLRYLGAPRRLSGKFFSQVKANMKQFCLVPRH